MIYIVLKVPLNSNQPTLHAEANSVDNTRPITFLAPFHRHVQQKRAKTGSIGDVKLTMISWSDARSVLAKVVSSV